MIDTNALKGQIVAHGMTREAFAKAVGMSPSTFNRKLAKGVFGSDEIERMVEVLNIDEPLRIFFCKPSNL